jgi:hypothetical protein
VVDVQTHCDADCEEGYHNPSGEKCERCGSWIHSRVIVVNAPAYGTVRVGTECSKELLGWSWRPSHDKAMEIQRAYESFADAGGPLWLDLHKDKKTPGMAWSSFCQQELRIGGFRVDVKHTWNAAIIRAALDLNFPWDEKYSALSLVHREYDDSRLDWFAIEPSSGKMASGQLGPEVTRTTKDPYPWGPVTHELALLLRDSGFGVGTRIAQRHPWGMTLVKELTRNGLEQSPPHVIPWVSVTGSG